MKKRIVVITSHYFYQPALDAVQRIQPDSQITVVPYDNFEHIAQVYAEHAETADAFLVSGSSAKTAIELSHPSIIKPIISFQVGSEALYKNLLELALENRQQDFSRVMLDFLLPLGDECSVEDYLKRREIDSVLSQSNQWVGQTGVQAAGGAEDVLMERIIELWLNKKMDMLICLYSSIVPALENLHIPYRCPFLTDEQLRQLISQVENIIELTSLRENLPAAVHILPRTINDCSTERIRKMIALTRQFMKDNMIQCVEQELPSSFQLFTTAQTLKAITHNFEYCSLSNFLNQHMDCPIVVGYGIGGTLNHALDNLQIALREAKFSGKSYLRDNLGNLIGPLGSENRMIVDTQAFPDVSSIAKRCNLSTMTVQKLITSMKQSQSDKVTTPELAKRFGITIRNANRILTNLKSGGVATPVYTQTTNSRGRPVQVYALNFK